MNEPFYYTWSRQDNAPSFECSKVEQDHFILDSGEKMLDLSSISFQASFGHRPKFIEDRIKKQVDELCMHSPKANFPLKSQVAKELMALLQVDGGKVFYTVSGAEAVENAIKMARAVTGRKVVASRQRSYHGATLGALSIGGDWRSEDTDTVDQWTLRLPEPTEDPNAEKARKKICDLGGEKIAAICLETITGSNGVIIPPESWYRGIQKICDELDIKLILDEISCGFYRTGKAFAFHHYNKILRPNFVCMAKSINGGVTPFGAVWTDSEIAKYFASNTLSAGLTNYAHPLGLASCMAVLEYTRKNEFTRQLNNNLAALKNTMSQFSQSKDVKEVRTIGMLAAIEMKSEISWQEFMKEGLHLVISGKQIILAPSLVMDTKTLTEGLEKLARLICH